MLFHFLLSMSWERNLYCIVLWRRVSNGGRTADWTGEFTTDDVALNNDWVGVLARRSYCEAGDERNLEIRETRGDARTFRHVPVEEVASLACDPSYEPRRSALQPGEMM